jgi:hypothetical protein
LAWGLTPFQRQHGDVVELVGRDRMAITTRKPFKMRVRQPLKTFSTSPEFFTLILYTRGGMASTGKHSEAGVWSVISFSNPGYEG